MKDNELNQSLIHFQKMKSIPSTLAPFFQEYDLSMLEVQKDAHTIIERVLQFGDRSEIRWLFGTYSQNEIQNRVKHFGDEKLPQPHRAFWRVVPGIQP